MKIINYEEKFGKYSFPEGFEERLRGRSIEEQMNFYRTTEYSSYTITSWSERTTKSGYCRLKDTRDVKALIVDGDLLVGAMILDDCNREVPCFAEECVCTYYAEDNNGAGYKIREDYLYLVCVPENFNEDGK